MHIRTRRPCVHLFWAHFHWSIHLVFIHRHNKDVIAGIFAHLSANKSAKAKVISALELFARQYINIYEASISRNVSQEGNEVSPDTDSIMKIQNLLSLIYKILPLNCELSKAPEFANVVRKILLNVFRSSMFNAKVDVNLFQHFSKALSIFLMNFKDYSSRFIISMTSRSFKSSTKRGELVMNLCSKLAQKKSITKSAIESAFAYALRQSGPAILLTDYNEKCANFFGLLQPLAYVLGIDEEILRHAQATLRQHEIDIERFKAERTRYSRVHNLDSIN